ncbi:hypothetical protein DMJ13_13615 [halophilic archaeon]|nr:hypothetical protein DMJ13_13615 [halophilic archaeon]
MTDDKFDLSRRKLLGAFGAMGAAGALGGAGTMAYFNDEENSAGNTFTAGELDLKIDWEEHYNGKKIEDQDLTNDPGPIFNTDKLDDVKPGDHGEATISLHVFDNPAWVRMAGELTSNDDNGLTEPEKKVDDTGGEGEGELADEIEVKVWYDGTEAEEGGGNNEFEDDELLIAEGSLREVLDQLEGGILLGDQTADGADAAQNGTVTTTFCGSQQSPPQDPPGGQAGQCIQCLPCDNPDVLATPSGLNGFCYEPGEIPGGATHVTLKAGTNCYVGEVSSSTTEICLPDDAQNEISNATFYRCPNGDGGNGDGDGAGPTRRPSTSGSRGNCRRRSATRSRATPSPST